MNDPTDGYSGEPIPLFEVNPDLDRAALAKRFAETGRLQIRDVLTDRTAREILRILAEETPWGISWQAGSASQPQHLRPQQVAAMSPQQRAAMSEALGRATSGQDYAFLYAAYPMVDSVLQQWAPGNPLDLLLEHINDDPFLDLLRDVSGMTDLIKADGQATLYQPGHFLTRHSDSHKEEGWRIAYVLNVTNGEWRTDWGGYLLFYDDNGNVIEGYRPLFNSLNLFAVPQWHSVSFVAPFAPIGRFAITGWARDR